MNRESLVQKQPYILSNFQNVIVSDGIICTEQLNTCRFCHVMEVIGLLGRLISFYKARGGGGQGVAVEGNDRRWKSACGRGQRKWREVGLRWVKVELMKTE